MSTPPRTETLPSVTAEPVAPDVLGYLARSAPEDAWLEVWREATGAVRVIAVPGATTEGFHEPSGVLRTRIPKARDQAWSAARESLLAGCTANRVSCRSIGENPLLAAIEERSAAELAMVAHNLERGNRALAPSTEAPDWAARHGELARWRALLQRACAIARGRRSAQDATSLDQACREEAERSPWLAALYLHSIGMVLAYAGDRAPAMAVLRLAIERPNVPGPMDIRRLRAQCHERLAQLAIASEPSATAYHYNAARYLFEEIPSPEDAQRCQRDLDRALASFRANQEADPGRLFLRQGDTAHEVTGVPFVIGRGSWGVDLTIDSQEISRKHCQIMADEDGFYLECLVTANPTTVDGAAVAAGARSATLRHGSRIQLGDTGLSCEIVKQGPGPGGPYR